MSKVVKKAKKLFQKVIPKEIKPFVAPIAAYYLGPMALKSLGGAGLTGVKGFLARAAASGVTSAATQKLVQDDVSKSSTLISALTGGLGAGYGGQGAQTADGIRAAKVAGVTPAGETIRAGQLAGMDLEAANALGLTSPGITGQAQNIALEAAAKASGALTPTTGKGIATLVGTAGTASGIEKEMELLDQYNQSLTEQGIEDKSERISLIRKYMANAGFDESQVTDALGRYGYLANGGRVGYQEGGDVSYTDYGRSGVIYTDQDGNPISKEKFLEETDKEEGIPSIRMKEEPKTLKDLLENPDAVKEMLRQGMEKGGTPVYLEDSILKDPRFSESMEGVGSLIDMLKSGIDKDKVMSFEEYKEGMDKYKKADKTLEPFGEEMSEKAEKYDLSTAKPSDRFPVEVMIADKMIEDKDKELSKIDEIYVKDMGVRKDAEKIFDSKEFKNWKSNLLSKDPKKKLMAETDPKAEYFDQIYFIFDRPGYMKDIRGYDMMSETESSFKDGGIINLKGREMDLRGGGFVPIGKKERADDVPARLSKNEFVFTADAVRGAGNGDVDKGAQKMYNTMKMLEGKIS